MSRNIVDQAKLIAKLSEHFGEGLHLTGSHFFGGATYGSDVDFFIQSHEDVEEVLKQWGFVRVEKGVYLDDGTDIVWRHLYLNIDIQLVKSLELKIIAQELILEQYGQQQQSFSFTPENWKNIWNTAFRQASSVLRIIQQRQ